MLVGVNGRQLHHQQGVEEEEGKWTKKKKEYKGYFTCTIKKLGFSIGVELVNSWVLLC